MAGIYFCLFSLYNSVENIDFQISTKFIHSHITKKQKTMKAIKALALLFIAATITLSVNAQTAGAKGTTGSKSTATTKSSSTTTKTTADPEPAAAANGDKVDATQKGPKGETVYTGPKGGSYYMNSSGTKVYLKKK